VVTGGWGDKTARVWNANTGESLGTPLQHDNHVLYAKFAAEEGKLITGDESAQVYRWDWVAGKQERKIHLETAGHPWAKTAKPIGPSLEHDGHVRAGAVAPDAKTVAVGTEGGKVRIWDPLTGKVLGPAMEHPGRVLDVAYSPDSSHIAVACGGGGRIWPLPVAMTGDAAEIRRRIECATGLCLDGEAVCILKFREWKKYQGGAGAAAPSSNPDASGPAVK
jgi:WD40 repeat protein